MLRAIPEQPPASELSATVVAVTFPRNSRLDALLARLPTDGKDFERLCQWYLSNDPVWKSMFSNVWLWNDWHGRWGPDCGIDLIADHHDGRVFAIQAKNYSPNHAVSKKDVDSFLTESNRTVISERLLVATTDRISRNAVNAMAGQEKPVTACLLEDLHRSELTWPDDMSELEPQQLTRAEPHPHQIEALEAINDWSEGPHSRGQILMACGTGKSLISTWSADCMRAETVLVLVPTLQLLRQTASTWTRHSSTKRRLLLVCGETDESLANERGKFTGLEVVQTTDPCEIARAISSDEPLLVIATYNSSAEIAKAMEQTDLWFDLAIADEAHRCAGNEGSTHKAILDEHAIRARKRLFFTATPTVYGTRDKGRARNRNVKLSSMDDTKLFGPIVHSLSFAEAIRRGLLTPYQVAIIPVSDRSVLKLIQDHRVVTADGDHYLDAASLAAQIACAKAMRRYGCRRMVAFQPTIQQSKRFVAQFPAAVRLLSDDEAPLQPIWSSHIDGSGMKHSERSLTLHRYCSEEPDEHRLLSNVRLLAEGVDIPAIDSVAFIDTHRGQVQIIQTVGRAVRKSAGKKVGTIVLPIITRDNESIPAALARSEHKHIVDILGALRSHDPEIIRSLDELRFSYQGGGRSSSESGRFFIDAAEEVDEKFADAVGVALAEALGTTDPRRVSIRTADSIVDSGAEPTDDELFSIGLDQLKSMARYSLIPQVPTQHEEFPIGEWWLEAKKRWKHGRLTDREKWAIASTVSWLATDLDNDFDLRSEFQEFTYLDVPGQCAAQLRPGGRLSIGPTESLAAASLQTGHLTDPFKSVHNAVSHAGKNQDQRADALIEALASLSKAIAEVDKQMDDDYWDRESRHLAALDGFALLLEDELDRQYGLSHRPQRRWRSESDPEAFEIGETAAREGLLQKARSLERYRFHGDWEVAEEIRFDQELLHPDERLDDLGWEICLLASKASNGDIKYAVKQGMDGTLKQRTQVRDDFIRRSAGRQPI